MSQLLQNAIILLQNAMILLQNASVITKCHKMPSGHSTLNHFWTVFLFCTPKKTTENLWFPGVFRGYKMGA